MLDKLSEIHDRYLEVEKLISSPDAMNDMKSYIQLSKEHHPDLLISKGVPTEVIEESKKKMRAINSAWDLIQKLKPTN